MLMKLSKLFSALAAIVGLSSSSQAQIAVPNGGVGPITFGTTPLVTEWATISMAGSGPTSSTEAQLDAAIAALTAAGINAPLPTSATVNPSVNGLFRHNTALSRIQSRPTTNNAAVLKATLLNTGATACGVTVSYVLGQYDTITEQIPGHRVYYSLNGTSWSAVGTFATPGAVSFNVIVGNWNNGSTLYLLWVDDNADPGADGSYTIDDVVFTPFVGNTPVSIVINTPTNSQQIVQGTSLSLTTTTTCSVTNVAFYSDGGLVGLDASSPFGIVVSNLSLGQHSLSAVATDASGLRATSAPVVVHIIMEATTPATVARQPQSLALYAGVTATFSVVAAGSPPFTYQWNRNGAMISGATNAGLTVTNVQPSDTGAYSVEVGNAGAHVGSSNATLQLLLPTIPGGYEAFVGTTMPLCYWRFSEPAGGTVVTNRGTLGAVANGSVVPLPPAPGLTLGAVGMRPPAFDGFEASNAAGFFDGANGYISVPALNLNTNTGTFVAWVKRSGTQTDTAHILSIRRSGSSDNAGLHFDSSPNRAYTDFGKTSLSRTGVPSCVVF